MFISCKDRIEYINLDNVLSIGVHEQAVDRFLLVAKMVEGSQVVIGEFASEEEAKNYAVLCLMRVK